MSKTSCAARCSRGSVQGVLRAPAEGEGGVAHREDLAATASATLERSAGTVGGSWQEGGARAESPPLEGLAPPARRPHAPWEARARAARVQTRPAKTKRLYYPLAKTLLVVDWWWGGGGGAHTNSELPQAGFP